MADTQISVINDYNNTDELLQRFHILNPTPVSTQMERNIQNRLLTGFANWNAGFETWKAWGDILYVPESLYNLYGVHLTLSEYQTSQMVGLSRVNMQLGDFHNMLICDDWCAIRYDVTHIDRATGDSHDAMVMEFVNFGDMGPELGTRVVEGWASTRGDATPGISHFVTPEELAAQQAVWHEVEAYQIPETDDLAAKYPVRKPTRHSSDMADLIQAAVLADFDAWNQGADAFAAHARTDYAPGFTYQHGAETPLALDEYLALAGERTADTRRLYFENLLISGEWAAAYYRVTRPNAQTGQIEAGEVMQFTHFEKDGDGVRATATWTL